MNVQVTTVSPTRKSLLVSLDPSEVDTEHRAVVDQFVRQVRLPGFRPGKAPAPVVAKRFGKEIGDEFKQKVVAKAYRGALEQDKLPVVSVVGVEEGKIAPGEGAQVTVTVDLRPEFTLPEMKGIAVEVASPEPTDAEVEQALEGLRGERADFKPAARPAQKGDFVKFGYEGFLEGRPIAEIAADKQLYGKVAQTWEEVEGEREGHLPGLGRLLAGLKAGDKPRVPISFPADFAPVPALAGRTADFDLEILEVRERTLPALDEAFFQAQGVKGLDELKAQSRERIREDKERRNAAERRRQVTDAVVGLVDFPVPESLVESETQSVLRRFIEEQMRMGVPEEQFEKDKKQLFTGARQAAQKRVKLQLILARVAEAEKIEVEEKDIDQYLYAESQRRREKPEKLARELGKDRDRLRAVQESIVFDKALGFLVSQAKVTVRP
ncbi:MAG: trigger factor [Opitutaceae bacterium]